MVQHVSGTPWHAEFNPETARPSSSSERQMRYQRRRAHRQALVRVWIDRADVAFLDTIPVPRSELIRGLVGMARRGELDLPLSPARKGLRRRLAELLGIGGSSHRREKPIFRGLDASKAPIMAPTAGDGREQPSAAIPGPAGSLLDYSGYLDDPEPAELLPGDLAPEDSGDDELAELKPEG